MVPLSHALALVIFPKKLSLLKALSYRYAVCLS